MNFKSRKFQDESARGGSSLFLTNLHHAYHSPKQKDLELIKVLSN